MKKLNIAVTGITGFVGQNLYAYLKDSVNIIGVFLFFIFMLIHYLNPYLNRLIFNAESNFYSSMLNMLLPILLIPFVINNVKLKSNKFDRYLGNLSYTIYLFHWTLIIPYSYYFGELNFKSRIPFAILYIIGTLVGAIIINRFVEQPIENFRNKISSKN